MHCTDEDQKSETIVYSLKYENYDKLTWKYCRIRVCTETVYIKATERYTYSILHVTLNV